MLVTHPRWVCWRGQRAQSVRPIVATCTDKSQLQALPERPLSAGLSLGCGVTHIQCYADCGGPSLQPVRAPPAEVLSAWAHRRCCSCQQWVLMLLKVAGCVIGHPQHMSGGAWAHRRCRRCENHEGHAAGGGLLCCWVQQNSFGGAWAHRHCCCREQLRCGWCQEMACCCTGVQQAQSLGWCCTPAGCCCWLAGLP